MSQSDPAAQPARAETLSPQQWRSGIAAWLGWLFDGLDMHLYTLVAAAFVAQLVMVDNPGDPLVKQYSSWIQAAFLIGWALGGGFFGRLGDKLGRSKALSLTILTYALFTGLSFFCQTWWQLMICRFLAALGIGGEWAVGASLLSETWPKRWRPWIAGVLQTGVNIGVLLACLAVYLIADLPVFLKDNLSAGMWDALPQGLKDGHFERYVFLVGVLPAFLVFWIRRHVPEPEEWHKARLNAVTPKVSDLFRPPVSRTTWLVIGVCAFSLTGWWAFMFWHPQHLRALPELAGWTAPEKQKLVSKAFFIVIAVSIVGNFFASFLAQKLGYRRAIGILFTLFIAAFAGAFAVPRTHEELLWWLPLIGFCSGVFGLFTMYLPPLFPTLLRTTGAGFCYNIGRIFAAFGTVFFGLYAGVTDLRAALLVVGVLFVPALFISFFLPEPGDGA